MSKFEVYRRQILMPKVDTRSEIIKTLWWPQTHNTGSNEVEITGYDFYDDFNLKKNIWFPWFTKKILEL